MVSAKSRCSRTAVVVAGALFVSPLAVAAFRAPTLSGATTQVVGGSLINRNRASLKASVLSDSLDSEEQQQIFAPGNIQDANDIISRAVEHQNQNGNTKNGGKNGAVNGKFTNPLRQKQKQHQRNIKKSRKNNKAMEEPEFLRKRTQALLNKTENNNNNHSGGTLKVDKRTFDWLIDAWSYTGEEDAADNALALLSRMEELRDTNVTPSISPDVKSYTKVINAIARSGKKDAGERAEELLNRMIEDEVNGLRPNTLTYTYVIDAYARTLSAKAPHAAQRLIEQMELLRSEGDLEVKPTTRAWNSVIAAWSQWKGEEMAWGRIGSGAERAEACLAIMEELANTTGNEEVRPNSFNYNSVISALANSQDEGAASRAEMILERMETLHRESGDENIKPRTATYNAIIDAWAKSGEADAANRAELLLAHMMELYGTGHNLDAKPNVRSFNSVLNAWAKSGNPLAPVQAAGVLQRMEELDKSSTLDVSPDTTSFATAINAYARSQSYGKAKHAHAIFLHMKELYDTSGKATLRPNNVVYNSVLNACAFSIGDLEEQSEAIEIANAMLVGLEKSPHGKPDQVTYGTYLKVINNQMPVSEARDKVIETIFRKCALDGMVGEMVIRQLKEMDMEAMFERITGSSMWGKLNLSELPSEWTVNVIEGKRMRRWQFRR